MSTRTLTLASLAIFITLALSWFLFHRQGQQLRLPLQQKINVAGQPTLGQASAPIDIVLFEDLKCFNCMRFNRTVLPALIARYVETGVARLHVITLAFIPGSLPAANTALCAYAQSPDFFFKFIDQIYENQPPEHEDWATITKLMSFARQVKGLNLAQLSTCTYQSSDSPTLQNNLKIARQLMGGTLATPTLYINGYRAPGVDIKVLSQMIKQIQAQQHG
jgi:protein-disulfide isomerase